MASPLPSLPEQIASMGHNRGSVAPDPGVSVKNHLDITYHHLVVRFIDLQLGCARVPDPIESGEEAGLVTDFIAQCQAHLKQAEAAHKIEKASFLEGGRTVDGFFKRRCESLTEALVPVFTRLKAYRDRCEAAAAERHSALMTAAEGKAAQAAHYRGEAERLATCEDRADHPRAAHYASLADATVECAAAMAREAASCLEPVRIQGDYGATAYVAHSWSFEVLNLREVPRHYLTLNAETVRTAITRDGIRDIPGLKIFQSESLRVRGVA
jgi:hypothetical protein